MKRIKKLTALLLALVSLASVLCFSVSARSPEEAGYEQTGYSPSAAVQYALYWANSYNSPGYETQSRDCTNFVSQCLYAGYFAGMDLPTSSTYGIFNETSKWYHKHYIVTDYFLGFIPKTTDKYKISTTWLRVYNTGSGKGLYQYLKDTKGRSSHYCTTESAVKQYAKVGDVIFCIPKGESEPNHAIIVSSIQNGNIYFCGHTNPRKDASFYDYCIRSNPYDGFYVVSMS